MSESYGQARHVSFEQLKHIMDFMGQHVEFASGYLRSVEARHTSKKLWGDLAKILNNCRGGTRKTADGWSKYWSDFKNKLKKKAGLLKKQKSGAAMKRRIRPLSKIEQRALIILGPSFKKKQLWNAGYEDILSDNNLPAQVKLESYQDIAANHFSTPHNETSDRLSGGDEKSNESESSGEEYVNDDELNEPIVRNLYPKWLIEVEKKRANAELIRAKAEEQKAVASSKHAEAALIQAEALRKLADASKTQADAIVRIATMLDSKGQTEDILTI